MPLTVAALLTRLRTADPGRPRLTWYGADGERVELSARVLENWVAKTANLLVEEFDAGPGTRVALELPPHWRSAVWALAAWAVGAELVARPAGAPPLGPDDVVVTTPGAPARAGAPGPHLVVVALGALAWSAAGEGPLPPGALDYNAGVAGFGDQLPRVPGASVDDLLAGAPSDRAGRRWESATPLLELAADYDPIASVLAPLVAGGGVVLLGPGAPDAGRVADQERAQRR